MLTPISKTFPLTAGKSYVGQTRPGGGGGTGGDIMALRPAPGMLKSIHANTLSSQDPCPAGNCWYTESEGINGPWSLWTSGIFCPDYGTYGAMFYWGGGHLGYDGTAGMLFDLGTQSWKHIGEVVATDFRSSLDPTWLDYSQNGSRVFPATHTYGHPVYIPPLLGGGSKGSFCLPFNVYSYAGFNGNLQPHVLDLATGISSRLTDAPYALGGNYGACWVDTKRGILWVGATPDSNVCAKIDLTVTPHTIVPSGAFYTGGYYYNPCYVESADMQISAYCDYGQTTVKLKGYDCSSGTPVEFTITETAPITTVNGAGFGFEWCPDTGKFYAYEGMGQTVIHVLTPPTNWKTGSWTWSTETMGGETPVNILEVRPSSSGPQVFKKWRYSPAIKCFMWSQGTAVRASPDGISRDGAFQLYRPLGT